MNSEKMGMSRFVSSDFVIIWEWTAANSFCPIE